MTTPLRDMFEHDDLGERSFDAWDDDEAQNFMDQMDTSSTGSNSSLGYVNRTSWPVVSHSQNVFVRDDLVEVSLPQEENKAPKPPPVVEQGDNAVCQAQRSFSSDSVNPKRYVGRLITPLPP